MPYRGIFTLPEFNLPMTGRKLSQTFTLSCLKTKFVHINCFRPFSCKISFFIPRTHYDSARNTGRWCGVNSSPTHRESIQNPSLSGLIKRRWKYRLIKSTSYKSSSYTCFNQYCWKGDLLITSGSELTRVPWDQTRLCVSVAWNLCQNHLDVGQTDDRVTFF